MAVFFKINMIAQKKSARLYVLFGLPKVVGFFWWENFILFLSFALGGRIFNRVDVYNYIFNYKNRL